jgi:hypothetical protein
MVVMDKGSEKKVFVRVEGTYVEVRDPQVMQFLCYARVCECVCVEGMCELMKSRVMQYRCCVGPEVMRSDVRSRSGDIRGYGRKQWSTLGTCRLAQPFVRAWCSSVCGPCDWLGWVCFMWCKFFRCEFFCMWVE